MLSEPLRKPLLIFYLLLAYVLLQFGWWTWSLFSLYNELADVRAQLNLLSGSTETEIIREGNEIQSKLRSRWNMIAGEATVFVALLLAGAFQIRRSFRKERELADRQRNFLLSVTHELKSPVASAKLQLETLLRHDLPRQQQQPILRAAIADANRLDNLIENILVAARIENGITLQKENLDLSAYVRSGMEQALTTFSGSHKVVLDIQPSVHVIADRTLIASVVINLFENAVKYAPPGSLIRISLEREGSMAVLRVADEGPGIASAEKEKIFERFYRSGQEETRHTKGTGLGLYISRNFCELHGGTLHVINNHPRGSIFEARFPLSEI